MLLRPRRARGATKHASKPPAGRRGGYPTIRCRRREGRTVGPTLEPPRDATVDGVAPRHSGGGPETAPAADDVTTGCEPQPGTADDGAGRPDEEAGAVVSRIGCRVGDAR